MKKICCLLCSLLLLATLAYAGDWVSLTAYQQPTVTRVLESTDSRILLEYQVNGYYQERILIQGEEYSLIGLESESRLWEAGNPDLPRLCRSVIIPDNALMQARVIGAQYRDIAGVKIAPSKGHLLRTVNPAAVPYEFSEVYQQDDWYPREIVQLRDPYILRDLRGQVIEVNAFQYNPVRQILRVYTNLTVEMTAAGSGGANILERQRAFNSVDPQFREIYRRTFLNFDEDRYTLVDEIGPMLIITYDNFRDAVMPLVNWKNQKGIPTTIVNVSTIGNNATSIKNYIRNAYQTDGLTFVLLVGDHAQVVSPISGGGTDPTYALLAGSDHYPELFVGRFSAESLQDVVNQVTKTLEYEKLPQAGAPWYAKGTGIASDQGAGIGHYGEADWVHMNYIRNDLLRYGYTLVDQIYDPGATAAMVSNALNNGRGIVNYCGHGSTTSWGTTGFSNTNVNALVNDNMLPFITSVACVVGNFTSSTCFAEAWLRASHNGEPTGAVAFYGSSQNQSWAPPMYAQDEFIDLMTADILHSYGALCFNGAMLMIDETGSTGESEFDHWHVFGDPSLQIRTAAPATLNAQYDNQINYGQPTFPVMVPGVGGALAAISYNNELLGNAYSDSTGLAVISITGQLPQGGYVTLTVTAYNYMPHIADLPVVTGGPDLWPPLISHTPLTTTTSPGPYVVNASIMDFSGVQSASIFYALNGGAFTEVPMTHVSGTDWTGNIPGQTAGTQISYYIHAVDNSPQHNAGNTSTYSFLILGILFSDNIENGAGNWTHGAVSVGWVDQWHISTENSHSATHAWKFGDTGTGNYANHADGGLVTPVITIGSDCELTYWQSIVAEASGTYPDSAYDGGVVEISHNGGPWSVLPLAYTHHIRSTAGGGNPYTGPFAPQTPVFSGSNAAWAQKSADLSAFVGDIQLRFRFGSDNSGNNEGWYIDDIQIVGMPMGTTPNVSITMTPLNPPIQIPASGGSFNFNIAVANGESTPQTFDAWCTVTLPNGSTYGPVLGPVNLTLPAGISLNRDRTQSVPGSAPAGNYSYNGYVGQYPAVVWDSDNFPFTKLTTGDGIWVGGWENSGESFEFEVSQNETARPAEFQFHGLYPNPFNPDTRFSFTLPEVTRVSLKIYDLQGRLVASLVDGLRDAGTHEITFDASQLASGIYLYQLQAGSFQQGGKMVLIK